jgi:23S rRNA (guanosine2251-2'-O)-methyltransferase
LVGEGEELIAGRRPVEEAFAARRDALRLLIVPERRAALDALAIHATTLRIPVVEVEGGTLTAIAGFDGHQGVALVARPRPAGDVDTILARARERGETPFVLVLDSLEDPQNFGTLLRSAEACGMHGVIYPTRRSAPLSPAAIKASAGATEHLILAAVDDLAGTLADLHGRGLRLVGADEEASMAYGDADLRGPLAVIVGSEGQGISGPVRRRLDLVLRIPMRGKIGSLNAAVAGSIVLFAAAAQRPEPAAGAVAVAAESKPAASLPKDSEATESPVVEHPAPTRKSPPAKAAATARKSTSAVKSADPDESTPAKRSAVNKEPGPAKKSSTQKTSASAKRSTAATMVTTKSPVARKPAAKRSDAAEEDLLPGDR